MEFSLGLVEVEALGHAILMLDDMLKAAEVEFVATERKLGGRLVTIVVKGELSAIKASVDAGVNAANQMSCLKAYQVIARPHPEILKFLHLEEKTEVKANAESAGTHAVSGTEKPKTTRRTAKTAGEAKPPAKRRGRPPAKK